MAAKEMELTEIQQRLLDKFECEHCHRKYTLEYLIEAFELYGVFFLIGENDCYIGINCPFSNCQKTLAITLDKEEFCQAYDLFLFFSESSPSAYLAKKGPPDYFSSVCYSSEQFSDLKNFNVITWQSEDCRKDDIVCHEIELGNAIADHSHLLHTHYCSYVPSSLQRLEEKKSQLDLPDFLKDIPAMEFPPKQIKPLGTFTVWWFRIEDVERIITLENKEGLKIFPRHIVGNPLFEEIDEFCWKHSLNKKYNNELERRNQDPKTGDIYLTSFLGMDILEIKSTKPEVYPLEELKKPPLPLSTEWDNERKLFTVPMFYKILSTGIYEPLCSYAIKEQYAEHENLVQKTIEHIHDGSMQEILSTTSEQFIADYIKQFQTQGFCYESVWNLKERYLKKVYEEWKSVFLKKKAHDDVDYAFYKVGTSWEIIFKGKSTGLVKHGGLKYIHYLIEHPQQEVETLDLCKLSLKENASEIILDNNDFTNISVTPVHNGVDHREKADSQYKDEVQKHLQALEQERSEAKRNSDRAAQDRIDREIDEIYKWLNQVFGKNGKARKFSDKDRDAAKSSVGNAILRALKLLKSKSGELYEHLNSAIPNKRVYVITYNPIKKVDWITHK